MKPAPFDYIRADSADEAVALLAEYGDDARVLAGGQTLLALLNMRLAQPRVLIDISRCADLDYARVEKGRLAIGAAATQAAVCARPQLAGEVPLLAQAFPHLGHFQTRNRGTVCGSIAHADPAAELPLCLAALGGEIVLRSARGARTLDAERFFLGALTTARAADELIVEVRFPLAAGRTRCAFAEVALRHGDFALAALAAIADADGIGLAVGGVADRPRLMRWPRLDAGARADALNELAWALDARDDMHASARYRRHLVRELGGRLLTEVA